MVLKRSIEPGNTVAASFQTPVLFLLAEELGQMELHVSMDEADVGMVKAGQSASFTVDACVSLLVGGIGIMNIMLVSVTERIREIGIRLAIGARTRDVLMQFLVESVALSTLGGIIGVILGIAGTWLVTTRMNMSFLLSPAVMLLGFFFSVAIWVTFGNFPARKAAHLNPIDALRHE